MTILRRPKRSSVGIRQRRTARSEVVTEQKVGDKELFVELYNSGKYKEYGMKYLSKDVISRYSADQLYELAYNGESEVWSNEFFVIEKQKEEEQLLSRTSDIKVSEGRITCPRCNYNRVADVQKQISSGDESATTFYRCQRCGHEWNVR